MSQVPKAYSNEVA